MTQSARILDAIRRLVQHLRVADRGAHGELGMPRLPVVERNDHSRVVAILTLSDLLRADAQRLEEERR